MLHRFILAIFLIATLNVQKINAANVGVLIMATGKYIAFIPPLIESAKQYFCTKHNVTYFVFTDQPVEPIENVVYIYQKKLGWPYDTMMRYEIYLQQEPLYEGLDYLFSCDADSRFVGEVGDEIFGERVATQHFAFVGRRGTYETDPRSLSCIRKNEGSKYFIGAFLGGTKSEMIRMTQICSNRINQDLANGIIPLWHEESHWNRYCIDYPPTVILSPSYCYLEGSKQRYPQKMLMLKKDLAFMRGD